MSEEEKYKELEGSVSVNGDMTPISRKPITKVNSTKWDTMSYEALGEQYSALQKRLDIIRTMNRPDLEKQMLVGLKHLSDLIQKKQPDGEGVTLI